MDARISKSGKLGTDEERSGSPVPSSLVQALVKDQATSLRKASSFDSCAGVASEFASLAVDRAVILAIAEAEMISMQVGCRFVKGELGGLHVRHLRRCLAKRSLHQ